MATVRMSSIEVLHEMFIVSSDTLRALLTKSTQGRPPERARRNRRGGTGGAAAQMSRPDAMIPTAKRPGQRDSGNGDIAGRSRHRHGPRTSCGLGWPSISPQGGGGAEHQTQGLVRSAPRPEPDAQAEFRSKCLGSDAIEVLHGEVGDVPPGHTTWDCYWASPSSAAGLARPDSFRRACHPGCHPARPAGRRQSGP